MSFDSADVRLVLITGTPSVSVSDITKAFSDYFVVPDQDLFFKEVKTQEILKDQKAKKPNSVASHN